MFKHILDFSNNLFKTKAIEFFKILFPIMLLISLITIINTPTEQTTNNFTGKYIFLDVISTLLQATVLAYIPTKLIHDYHQTGANSSISDYYYGALVFVLKLIGLSLIFVLIIAITAMPGGLLLFLATETNSGSYGMLAPIGGIILILPILFVFTKLCLSPIFLICEGKSIQDSFLASYYSIPNNKAALLFIQLVTIFIMMVLVIGLVAVILGLALTPLMSFSLGTYTSGVVFLTTLISAFFLIYQQSVFYSVYLYFKNEDPDVVKQDEV